MPAALSDLLLLQIRRDLMHTFRGTRARRALALVTVALLGLGLTACQSGSASVGLESAESVELPPISELTPAPDPRNIEGPTTALIGGPSIAPVADAPAPELPATVTSHDRSGDTEVTVTDTSRVLALSLSGSLGELVHAYGMSDQLVGRDISTNFPGSEDLPIVTRDGHSIDAEGVLGLSPTVILTDGSIGPTDVVLQMRDAGIPVITVDRAVDAATTFVTAQQVADALGVPESAPPLIDTLQAAISAKEAEVATLLPEDPEKLPRVAFLYVRGTSGIYYLFGEGSGVDSLIRSIGALDVAAEIGWKGEKPMTDEALIAIDPDVILVMTKGLESAGGVDGLLEAQPSIALTTAGKNRRIIDVDDTLLFAGGTRIPDVIDGLARAVYAPDSLQ
ncbi:Heme ABC transporter, cell surface heme and hemoprotein receptor HmuT [Leucobacter sp. 7(1)]|uniref:heme/hemin ABC transporter substrate-binding protein n=1 Tax=Leucobacter sp. 7(1) TaxID=1255613 RepID=UPI00097EB3A3|nr:ABC transporter substrate-binding protein [Leucobacter sp. 7(1)]SJN08261.1 Heme ABC transporter, cell surface heme and hemoprotein receptor HmuT [Leucobacter sp. 7(1)]